VDFYLELHPKLIFSGCFAVLKVRFFVNRKNKNATILTYYGII